MAETKLKDKPKDTSRGPRKVDQRLKAFKNLIPKNRKHDPLVYPEAESKIRTAWHDGLIGGLEAGRMMEDIRKACLKHTRVPFEEAASLNQDPLLNQAPLFERTDDDLLKLEEAITALDADRLTLNVKKKWILTIKRLLQVRKRCRADAAAFWLYVGKDDNPQRAGQQFVYAKCHVLMFAIWNDEEHQHSLIMAPVGHGKSTCLRGQIAFEIGTWPELRHLYITQSKELAQMTVGAVRRIVASARFRAIFPDLHVLGQSHKAEDSTKCFTVGRMNDLAKDPTFRGAGYRSAIQGNRYDRIWPDDICPPEVQDQALVRAQNVQIWNSVVRARQAHPKYSRIRMIGTPWHIEDVLGTTWTDYEAGRLPQWYVEVDAFRIKIDDKDVPIPIWPEVWDATTLQRIRNTNSAWSSTYELKFGRQDIRIIKSVRWYNSSPRPGDPQKDQEMLDRINQSESWLSIDPSGTGASWSSGQGVVQFNRLPSGWLFLTNVWFFRCTGGELIDHLVDILHDGAAPGGTRFTGTQWEVQGAVKVGFDSMMKIFKQSLEERGVDPGQLRHVEYGTKFGGTRQSMSKLARFQRCAPYIENGSVRLAGRRVFDRGVTKGDFLGAIPGSDMHKLGTLLKTWDGDKRTSDAIDAVSQFILAQADAGRIASPNVRPEAVERSTKQYSHNHMVRYEALQKQLNAVVDTDPMKEEDEFYGTLDSKFATAGAA